MKPQSLARLLSDLESEGARPIRPTAGAMLSLSKLGTTLSKGELQRRETALELAIDAPLSTAQRSAPLKACALLDQLAESIQEGSTRSGA